MTMTKEVKRRIINTFGLGTYKGIYLGYLKIVPMSGGGIQTKYTGKPLGIDFGINWFHAHQLNPFLSIKDYD